MFSVTAGGKQLDKAHSGMCDPKAAYAEWLRLPEAERKPGAVVLPQSVQIDPFEHSPPPGGLILKVYHRVLGRKADGEWRHANRQDFMSREQLMATLPQEVPAGRKDVMNYFDYQLGEASKFEAGQDFMWLTQAEWQSLVPASPKVGGQMPVPTGIAKRLFVYQLDPVLTFGESNGWFTWGRDQLRDGKLTLTVEQVSEDRIRMRIDGFALLGKPYDPAIKPKPKFVGTVFGFGYEPRLLGYLEYDRRRQKFARFDLVAVGDMYGVMHEALSMYFRPGRQPLGIALELVQGDAAADRYPPRCARGRNKEEYFNIK